jgi:hypothetical protein
MSATDLTIVSSSLISEEPSPEEFRIRGAASEAGGRKLTKRKKTGD